MFVIRTSVQALVCLTIATAGCNPDTSIRPDASTEVDVTTVDCNAVTPTVTVAAMGPAYNPTPTTIAPGGVVKFVMGAIHNVSSQIPGLTVSDGATTCLAFAKVGTYSFVCSHHGFMGTVVVQ